MERVKKSGEMCLSISMPSTSPIQARCTAEDEDHPFAWLLPACQTRHHLSGEAGRVLLALFDDGQVDELVVPLARIELLSLFIDCGSNHHLHHRNVIVADRLRR